MDSSALYVPTPAHVKAQVLVYLWDDGDRAVALRGIVTTGSL